MVTVPNEAKVYTTTYEDFKGVDLTNDITNVWKRRSPDGKNMLPSLDGKPYKRKGWDIDLTPADFRSAAGVSGNVEVIPDRMYYFELGGYDFLMIFNNLGIFSYTVNPLPNSPFKRLLVHHSTYLNKNNQTQSLPGNIDPRKAFFFEGGGTAGFYVFAGTQLFRYDGAYFREAQPYVPLVLIGCEPNGAGTMLEGINLLTKERIIQYACAHTVTTTYDESGEPEETDTGPSSFIVPGGFSGSPTVETRNAETAAWEPATGYTAANGKIDFTTPPAEVVKGEDNLRVTYTPDGSGARVAEETVNRKEKTIFISRSQKQKRTKKGKKSSYSAWENVGDPYYAYSGTRFDASGIKTNASTKVRDYTLYLRNEADAAWTTYSSGLTTEVFFAYDSALGVSPNKELFDSVYHADEENIKDEPTTTINKHGKKDNSKWDYTQERWVRKFKTYRIKMSYTSYTYYEGTTGTTVDESMVAFSQCARALVFGSGIINQVFLTASPYFEYNTRMWYSAATDPTYWPDTNYIEVGATDTPVMGLMKVGEYLGVIKKGTSFDTSIYLAYPTSFDNDTTYAVKQNINGIGAISTGAFNILNEEPLFLSKSGIMGIEVSQEDTDRQLRNRSFYVNKRLCAEPELESAISFVYDGLYYLAVSGNCYVLDGSQKNSWQNTKTNLQYEAYFLDNIPAQCFARFDGELYFTDFKGNLCRFRNDKDEHPYRDAYSLGEPTWTSASAPSNEKIAVTALTGEGTPKANDTVKYSDSWYTITSVEDGYAYVTEGVPIDAVWSTISDDDGAVHYFKNLQKKGCVVTLLPASDSGVKVYLKPDSKEPIYIGETDTKDNVIPSDYYVKKKVKKYKRLQIICENDVIDDSFGIDQIVKSYTLGNYSKNKG